MNSGTKNKTYLIVGLGRLGKSLAVRLAESGAHVIAVDKLKTRVDDVADKLEYVGQLDATDEASLAKIGAESVDIAVVCLGERAGTTILVTAILLDMGIPKVISRASDEMQAKILSKIGAHEIFAPEVEMGHRIADRLENPWMKNFLELDDNDHIAGKMKAPRSMTGSSLKELALPDRYGAIVLIVERNGKKILPYADLRISENDEIWFFGKKLRMAPLLENIETEGADMEENR